MPEADVKTLPAPKTAGPPYDAAKCVEVGDSVQWVPSDGDNRHTGLAAVVTEVGSSGVLSLAVFLPRFQGVQVKQGVRHVSDPRAKDPRSAAAGCWRHGRAQAMVLQEIGYMKHS